MRALLAVPLLALLAAPLLAPEADAFPCPSPTPGSGLVGATVYLVTKTAADACGSASWYSCYVLTAALGPGHCLA